jgi:hypothetical protein
MRQECHTLRKFPTLLCLPACGTVLEESTAAQLTTSLVLVELKINNRLHKTSLLDPNLSQMNPVRIYIPYLFNNLDIMPSSTFRFPFRPFSKFCKNVSSLPHYYISRPHHYPSWDNSQTITWLTDWRKPQWSEVPSEKPTVTHLIETFSAPDGTRRLITVTQEYNVEQDRK